MDGTTRFTGDRHRVSVRRVTGNSDLLALVKERLPFLKKGARPFDSIGMYRAGAYRVAFVFELGLQRAFKGTSHQFLDPAEGVE